MSHLSKALTCILVQLCIIGKTLGSEELSAWDALVVAANSRANHQSVTAPESEILKVRQQMEKWAKDAIEQTPSMRISGIDVGKKLLADPTDPAKAFLVTIYHWSNWYGNTQGMDNVHMYPFRRDDNGIWRMVPYENERSVYSELLKKVASLENIQGPPQGVVYDATITDVSGPEKGMTCFEKFKRRLELLIR